jgi:hypothetical protein
LRSFFDLSYQRFILASPPVQTPVQLLVDLHGQKAIALHLLGTSVQPLS